MAIGLLEGVIDELTAICGPDRVFAERSAVFNRARVPAPFPAHRWEDHIPLRGRAPHVRGADLGGGQAGESPPDPRRPQSRRDRLDGRRRPPPSRDPRRRQADEQDPRDRRRQPHGDRRPRDQHAQAQRGASQARLHLSGQSRVVPVLAGGRADRHQRLVADRCTVRHTRAIW